MIAAERSGGTSKGSQLILSVRGDVDLVTAPELGMIVDAVIDRGHRSVVFDLAEVGFMDIRGLNVIARAAARLGSAGEIIVRSPSAPVARIVAITGLAAVVRVERRRPDPDPLGAEQTPGGPGATVTVEAAGLVARRRRVTAIPADDDVVDAALRLVVTLARATVGGADGVSVSLNRQGRLATVAASDQTVSDMDAAQYVTGNGPCVDASTKGRWFHAESLDNEPRWPTFVPEARKLGIKAILSTPLMAGRRPVGALNIYSRTARAFAARDQELASVFATEASVILRDAGVGLAEDALAQRLDEALGTREVIAQAQGVVMAREGLSAEDAYATLRLLSRRGEQLLRDLAADVVASTRPPLSHDDPREAPDG